MHALLLIPLLFGFLIPITFAENKESIIQSNEVNLVSKKYNKDDLEVRDGLYYLKDSDVPYSGKVIYKKNEYMTESGELNNGQKVGEWKSTYNSTGKLHGKTDYENGKRKDGLGESFHWNGELWNRVNIKDGKMDGIWEEYHDNGQLASKVLMVDGEAEGLWEVFYKNGKLYYSGNYINGISSDGLWEFFHPNGSIRFKGNKKNGKRDGEWEFFNKDGSLEKVLTYKDGLVSSTFTPPSEDEITSCMDRFWKDNPDFYERNPHVKKPLSVREWCIERIKVWG